MGLDQYLFKRVYIGGQYAENKNEVIKFKRNHNGVIEEKEIKIEEIDHINCQVMYWRKNYVINDFFMNRLDKGMGEVNCIDLYCEQSILVELKEMLEEILEQDTLKEKKVKTLELFSFVEDLDDLKEYFENYYLPDFEATYQGLKKIIEGEDFNKVDFYYHIWY